MRCPHCGRKNFVRTYTDWKTERVTYKCFDCGRTWEMYNGEDNEAIGGFY